MASQSKNKVLTSSEIGDTGVQIFNGIITGEEYNRNLTGYRGLLVWDEMRRSDATVGASLRAVKLPIKSTKFFMNPATDDDLDVQISEFVNWNLFERLKWKQVLGEILTHLEFGFSVHEMVFGVETVEGVERVVLIKLAFRKQTSVSSWEADKTTPGVTFRKADGTTVPIPLEKIVVFTNEQEGDNYEGRSILRTAYKHWFYVDKYYQIDAVGHERHSLGVVKIKHPTSATDTQRRSARAAARNLRASEESYIEEPQGWDINFMDMQGNSLKDIQPSINRHDRQITKSVLAQFLEIGSSGSSGTRSTSEDHRELFNQSVQAVLDYVKDTMGYVVKTLVDLNFNVDAYPTVGSGKVDQKSIGVLAEALSKFNAAGLITVSDEDEAYARNLLGFPDMNPDDARDKPEPGANKTETKTDVKDKESADEIKAARRGNAIEAQVSAREVDGLLDGIDMVPEDRGCIMLDTELLEVRKFVENADDDLAEKDGFGGGAVAETEAHVTLLYGLLENGNIWKKNVDKALEGWSLDSVTIDHVDKFDLGDSYAIVAHIEATEELIDAHDRLTLLPNAQTFSEYKPHLTMAYVKHDDEIATKWIDALGAQYNGKTLKTAGINYGDLPDEDGIPKEANALKKMATKVSASLTRMLYGNKTRTP
ncbi:phage gp29-like protein/2'-5' RNA ligase [Arthrobacter sp. UYCu511]|uniref:phage portal protein family protein n=1 Tax=Arthrobacter sp. UYCu511 TaxID=3156337 RepID=UPI00339A4F02